MNQLKAGAVLNYVIVGLNIVTGLLYTPFMLRCLGQNEYGLYSLVASVIAYLTLLDFGFGSAIVRYTAKIRATREKKEEWSLYGMFLSTYTVLGLLVTIGGIVLYFNTDYMFDRTMTPDELYQARVMLALMVGNLAITFPFSVFGSIITAYEQFVFQRCLTIIRILLSTAVMIAVLYMGYKAIALVVVQTVFSVGTLLCNVLYCRYKLKIKIIFRNFNLPLLKEILIFSFWNFLGAIVDRIYWSTGQFILGIYTGTVAVAIYSLAITIMHMYMSMSTSLNSVLLPKITVMATKNGSEKDISDIFIRTGRLQFYIMSLMLTGFVAFGYQFIILWGGEDYAQSYYVSLLFLIFLFCPLIENVGLTIMAARGSLKFRSASYLFVSIFSFILQLNLTKDYGVIGCSIAIAIGFFIGHWVIMNIYYYKRQKIDVLRFGKEILRISIFPILLMCVCILFLNQIELPCNWTVFSIEISIFISMFTIGCYFLSMNKYEKSLVSELVKKVLISK